jgi:predicted metal-dependent HD superfamily phosphohydrolase
MPILDSWVAAWGTLAPGCDPAAVDSAGQSLISRYAEPHRRYHSLLHVTEMIAAMETLAAADQPEADPADRALGVLVAWFHDAVYDPWATDNEARSADVARDVCRGLGLAARHTDVVVELIEATAAHDLPSAGVAASVHDADLWILSAPAERFDDYCAQVRQEYAHVEAPAYRAGRSLILRSFLDREQIYATPLARREWTCAARSNVDRELARLAR